MRLSTSLALVALVACFASTQHVLGDGLPVEYGLLPLGDLTTQDQGGPYAIPDVQAFEVEAAIAAKTGAPGGPFTDADVLNFLTNTECLEATFNTYAAFGAGLPASLKPGAVAGGRRAKLSSEVQSWVEEVALDEQGHVRMVRQVLGDRSVPCPSLDLSGGFRSYFDAALNTTSNPPFDPFKNDVNFLLATWSLEEIGATGDKGCILLASNPGVANCIAGLAGAASYQSGVDRHFLWQRRNETVPEYNKTVHQIVEAISDLRDTWDGPGDADQALYNGNPAFIAVPSGNINLVPTDIRGLTFSRTPQQVLRIVTLSSETGKGGFFPQGLSGKINSPAGYNVSANGFGGFPGNQVVVRSLQEANRTQLLNNNITVIVPPPLALQAEASGQEYNTTASNATEAPASVTLIGTASPSSPSPDNTTARNETLGNTTTTSGNMTESAGNGTASVLEAGPSNTANATAANTTMAGADNTTTMAADNTTMAADNTTAGAMAANTTSGTAGTTSSVPVIVVPIATVVANGSGTNASELTSMAPAVTSTGAGANNTSTAGGTSSPSTFATAPTSNTSTAAATTPSPSATGGSNTAGNGTAPTNTVATAPATNTSTSSSSPAPSSSSSATNTTPSDAGAAPGSTNATNEVVVPISTALNATSTNQTQLTTGPPAVTATPGATNAAGSGAASAASPAPSAAGSNATNSSLIAPISSPAVAVLNVSAPSQANAPAGGARKLMRRH